MSLKQNKTKKLQHKKERNATDWEFKNAFTTF